MNCLNRPTSEHFQINIRIHGVGNFRETWKVRELKKGSENSIWKCQGKSLLDNIKNTSTLFILHSYINIIQIFFARAFGARTGFLLIVIILVYWSSICTGISLHFVSRHNDSRDIDTVLWQASVLKHRTMKFSSSGQARLAPRRGYVGIAGFCVPKYRHWWLQIIRWDHHLLLDYMPKGGSMVWTKMTSKVIFSKIKFEGVWDALKGGATPSKTWTYISVSYTHLTLPTKA